jgi:hypothetical protein
LSIDEDTILAAMDRSIKLDSGFRRRTSTPPSSRSRATDATPACAYADRYLSLQPSDEEATEFEFLPGFSATVESQPHGTNLDTLSSKAIQTDLVIARRWPDSSEIALRLLPDPEQGRMPSAAFIYNPGRGGCNVVAEPAYRGRFKQALDTLGTNIGGLEPSPFSFLR